MNPFRRALLLSLALLPVLAGLLSAPAQSAPDPLDIRVNEVESNGDTADWIELTNVGDEAVDIGGWVLKDNDDTHTYVVSAGTTVAPGAFVAFDVDQGAPNGSFGLGASDSARVFLPDGSALVDAHTWSGAHAATTFGRCPDGSGAFRTTTASTKAAANNCSSPVKVNEVESSGGAPVDWIELSNPATVAADVSGFVLKDNNDASSLVIAAGTSIPAGGYLAIDVDVSGGFGLGGSDSARLFAVDGTTLVDSYTWTTHATTTYGRCPNGSGVFTTTASATKGAPNDCGGGGTTTGLKINEIESNGDSTDWVELVNTSASPIDLGGLTFRDNDASHAFYAIPAGTTIAAGGYYIVDGAAFGFGLGAPDSATLYLADTTTVVDTHEWTSHAPVTYGRCPNGTGPFSSTATSTKGAANDCSPVKINEVESDTSGSDWVELVNTGSGTADIGGWVLKDGNDAPSITLAAGTTIPAGGYLAVDTSATFGLGGADSARLFLADGTTLADSYTWSAHATTTYGRCPSGSGPFTTTTSATKGAVNACPGDLTTSPWPGGPDVTTSDPAGFFASNLSGLAYEPGVLWASRNGPGTLFRMVRSGDSWVADTANGWGAGKTLRYGDGTGDPDAEGITFTSAGSAGGMFVATERNNAVSGTSRPTILRYDVSGSATTLNATQEWNLTADLPSVGANLGLEAISWVPDSVLTAKGFVDNTTGAAYDPAAYPNHGGGLFFVGLEANGAVYAYALDMAGGFTKVATIASGFPSVMELTYEPGTQKLWAVCDDTCQGRSAVLEIDGSGHFVPTTVYERPSGMPNLNNEGFAIPPDSECVSGRKPVYWADDSSTGGHALRTGSLNCTAPAKVGVVITADRVSYLRSLLSGKMTFSAKVTRADSGGAVVGLPVTFAVTTPFKYTVSCLGVTNTLGRASCTSGNGNLLLLLLPATYQATTQATTEFLAGSGSGLIGFI